MAICAYICLFTGVPTLVFRVVKPARPASVPLRAGLLLLLSLALLLPDILYYLLWRLTCSGSISSPSFDQPVPDAGQLGDRRNERLALGADAARTQRAELRAVDSAGQTTTQPVTAAQGVAAAGEPGSAPAVH